MSDLFGNHIVCFPTRRLICCSQLLWLSIPFVVVKTKELFNCMVSLATMQLICTFVFAICIYAKYNFSHDMAHNYMYVTYCLYFDPKISERQEF